ncbi:hypothetical protein KBY57_12905 [Cyanobium sp. Aljojuca 7D2]|uniref:virulence-associated E family protein n=1 Tax=Cyanobium sp. Aljojuca 7D2 TaxID=2823698 RepID=UPI0020CC43B0|nr:virulence-associated E family protein [Cyanobium sp. Aljojuca 7D2]MCP9891944.1 hypothetical protein [Cyanobium sp. Aljojuca 7D2]
MGFRLFVNGKAQTSSGLFLPFGGKFGQLRCDNPPLNARGEHAKYLNRARSKAEPVIFGDGEPTHATEGWKDALRLHLELGVTTCGIAGVGHWPLLPASVRHLIYDADASINPAVWGQLIKAGLARRGLKLAFFPADDAGPKGGACEFFANGGSARQLSDLLAASLTGRKLLLVIGRSWDAAEMPGPQRIRNLQQLARLAVLAELAPMEAEALVVEDACKRQLKLPPGNGRALLDQARRRARQEAGDSEEGQGELLEGAELQDFILDRYKVEWDLLRRRVVVNGEIPRGEQLKLFYQDLSCRYRIKARKEEAKDALEFLAHSNPYNPIARYIESLKQRRDELRLIPLSEIGRAFGFAPEDGLSHQLLARKLVQQLKRGLAPGYKADEMLIFYGTQGDLKSEAIKALAPEGDWLAAATEIKETDDWKFLLKISQCWIYLIDECDKFLRGKDSATLKSVLTITSDTYALKGFNEVDGHDRLSTFWGTTNERELFNDHTGVRRWWIACVGDGRRADPGWIKQNRDSIWATAYTWAMHGLESYLPRGSNIEQAAAARAWNATYGLPYEAALRGVLEALPGTLESPPPAIAQSALIQRGLEQDINELMMRNKKAGQDLINDVRRVVEQVQFRTHGGLFRWEKKPKLRLEGFPNPVAGYRALAAPQHELAAADSEGPLSFQSEPIPLVPACSAGVPTRRNGQTDWPNWDFSYLFRPFQENREVKAMGNNNSPTPMTGLSLAAELPSPQKVGTVGTVAEIDCHAMDLPVPTPPPMSEHPSEQTAAAAHRASPLVDAEGAGCVAGSDAAAAGRPELEANAARSNLTEFEPGDRVYVAHQLLPFGRLHQAVVSKVINAEVHFDPRFEGLLNDPQDPGAGGWMPPAPLRQASSSSCLPELGAAAGITIKQFERDGQQLRRLSYRQIHADGSETTVAREIPVPKAGYEPVDEDGLDTFLAELQQQDICIAKGLQDYRFSEAA